MKRKNDDKFKELRARLIEFKEAEGDRPIDDDYLEKIVDIAEECFGSRVQKAPNTKPNGSKKKQIMTK